MRKASGKIGLYDLHKDQRNLRVHSKCDNLFALRASMLSPVNRFSLNPDKMSQYVHTDVGDKRGEGFHRIEHIL